MAETSLTENPTAEAQARTRRARVAEELGVHPSRTSQAHADYHFDRLGAAFMVGWKRGQRRGSIVE